jgi:RND family efflux transporter MFP subunit
MKVLKQLLFAVLLVSSLFIQGCEKNEANNSLNNSQVNVEVEVVKNFDGSDAFYYSGTIEESELTPLSFSGIGTVSKVYVSEGDCVRKGQLLAELKNDTYKNAFEMSSATLKQAEDAYKRLEVMYKNGNLPEIKYIEVETALQQAKAAAAISKRNLEDCKLYSPIDGIVGKRSIEPGMSAMPNLASINIVKIGKVYALVSVSENEIASVNKGDKAKIKIAALNNAEYTGAVEEIGVMADPLAHSYKIKIGIVNNSLKIKPGMICSAVLLKSPTYSGIVIPSSALLNDEKNNSFVYAASNGKAVKKYVATGKLLKSGVEITNGLKEGELIVVEGLQKLVDNSLIRIVNQ